MPRKAAAGPPGPPGLEPALLPPPVPPLPIRCGWGAKSHVRVAEAGGEEEQGGEVLPTEEATACWSVGSSPLFHIFLNLERRFWNQIFTWEGGKEVAMLKAEAGEVAPLLLPPPHPCHHHFHVTKAQQEPFPHHMTLCGLFPIQIHSIHTAQGLLPATRMPQEGVKKREGAPQF